MSDRTARGAGGERSIHLLMPKWSVDGHAGAMPRLKQSVPRPASALWTICAGGGRRKAWTTRHCRVIHFLSAYLLSFRMD